MFVQVGLEGESLPASSAHVRFCVRMGLDVRAKVGFVCKSLAADRAFEGFFA